jgi:hypothetical protein
MLASSTRTAGPYTGTGSQTAFPFSFKVFQASDLLVVQTDASGTNTTLTLTSQYTVALNPNQDTSPGGTVNLITATPSGYTLSLLSQLPALQNLTLANAGNFYPAAVDNALDYITILIQQLAEQLGRAVKVSIGNPLTPDQFSTNLIASGATATTKAAAASASATAAAGSATAAAGSATAAAVSAGAASGNASASASSASGAAVSAAAASSSATTATNQAASATGSATAAATSATTATNQAAAATGSATAAATSATTATNQAAAATGSATAAATSATTATNQAASATGSATAASTSATSAAASAAAAAGAAAGAGHLSFVYIGSGTSVVNGSLSKASYQQTNRGTAENSYNPFGFYDVANSRFKPTAAGWYHVSASMLCPTSASGYYRLYLYKNGSQTSIYADMAGAAMTGSGGQNALRVSAPLYFNGTTDYVEAYFFNSSGATATLYADTFSATFAGS